MAKQALHVLLAQPRGFCAGVVRAVDIVERALRIYGPPRLRPPRDCPQQARCRESAREGGSLRGRHRRHPDRCHHRVQRPWGIAQGGGRCRRSRPAGDRRDLSAGEQGAQRNDTLRAAGTRDRPHRTPRHHPEVEGTMGRVSGAVHLVSNVADVGMLAPAEVGEACVRDADDAQRRRHARDHRGAEGAVSRHPGVPT